MPTELEIPLSYYIASIILATLTAEAISKLKRNWAISAIIVYITTGIWYFTEVFYTPERLVLFNTSIVEQGYYQVSTFLIVFRCTLPSLTNYFSKKLFRRNFLNNYTINPNQLLRVLIILWIILFIYGVSLLNWDFAQALFPRGGRWAPKLWSRGGVGEGFDFITSALGYTYALVCAMFGVIFFFQRSSEAKLINFFAIMISWPAFYLSGTRNAFLAVSMPAYLTYLITSKQKLIVKILVSIAAFMIVDYLFLIVINLRNTGIDAYFEGQAEIDSQTKHQGLNMAEELFYINTYYEYGLLKLQYGLDYIAEALNIIPRFILPDKPAIGYEYNLIRNPDSGIQATISAGMIGRGIMNFGPIFGAAFPAVLMATWSACLARLWQQRESILRMALFLVGLGITPNLGRDITLLVLWPMIFGYIVVRYLEKAKRSPSPPTGSNKSYYKDPKSSSKVSVNLYDE